MRVEFVAVPEMDLRVSIWEEQAYGCWPLKKRSCAVPPDSGANQWDGIPRAKAPG
jgi:hypothetical protein